MHMQKAEWDELTRDQKIWHAGRTLADVAYFHSVGRSAKDEASRRGIKESEWAEHVERCFRFALEALDATENVAE